MSVLPLVVVCCVVVLIIASYVGTNINSNAGFISIGVGFLVSDGIVEHYNERLSAKRKKQIESKYADLINAKDEKERLIINCREMLHELCSQYDALSRRQRSWWAGLSGWSFEREVAKVFQLNGYDARVTKGSNDGGIDINLYKNAKRIIVQCKNYKAAVGPAPVRDLFGVLTSVRAHGAIMVSRTSYTKGAVQFADKHGIKLMVLDDVIKMYENVG